MFGTARVRRQRRGSNAIEFAMTLPFYLAIVLGLMDYGFLFGMQAGIDNANSMACREGAMQDPNRGSPKTRAEVAFNNLGSMFCAGGACGGSPGIVVTDRSDGDYAFPNRTLQCTTTRAMTPLIGFVPYPATINSVSFYRLEWQRQP